MPPDGYKTVTLPVSLIDQLDELDTANRAAAIGRLLDHYNRDGGQSPVTLEATERRKIAKEVAEMINQ